MIARKSVTFLAAAALFFTMGACMDLEVTNPNEPERERALSNAGDVEALIRSQFLTYWGAVQGGITDEGGTGPAFDNAAEVMASTSANNGTWDMGMIPPIAIVNQVGYPWSEWLRASWLNMNRGLAAIRSSLISIEEQNLGPKLTDENRVRAFAKFMQGLYLGYIALMYDRGVILDETVEDVAGVELQPYGAIMQAALGYLDEARTIAQNNTFDLPAGYLGPDTRTSQDLVRLTHSYQARFMSAVARTPAEREAVDWQAVLDHVNAGITTDFGINLEGPGGVWVSPYKSGFNGRTTSLFLPLLGPADQDSDYIDWEAAAPRDRNAFTIDTPDRRITDGTPTGAGTLVEYRDFISNNPTRGSWFISNYAPKHFRGISDTNGFGFATELSVEEMEFLAAEAHIRMGNPDLALPLINDERVSDGQLPAATTAGAVGPACVPRAVGPLMKASDRAEGDCGDLMQTLIYEKKLELYSLSGGLSFFDSRGWGILRTGRPIHAPVPMEDLQVLDIPHYTFGGGGEGSAN